MNIDIFTCKFGSGHSKSAKELVEFIDKNHNVNINTVDFIESIYPYWSTGIYRVHNHYYQLKNLKEKECQYRDKNFKRFLILKVLMIKKLFFKYMDSIEQPDIYISCYSLTSYLLSEYKKERGLDIPLITFITDFNFHRLWINENTNLYLVMSNFTKNKLQEIGIPKEKVIIFGNKKKVDEKRKSQNVLICGGGLGMLPKDKNFYRKLGNFQNKKFRIVCGKNKKLYEMIEKLAIKNVKVYGLVDNMEDLYCRADLYITKAGGRSIYDSISNDLPIIYFTPFLNQEIENKQFIREEKVGMELKNEDLKLLDKLFRQKDYLEEIRENLNKLREDFAPEDFNRWLNNAVC